jgi:hypothetical protein
MKKIAARLRSVVLVGAELLFFAAMFRGLRDWLDLKPLSFANLEGLALGLFFICLWLQMKVQSLGQEISELKKIAAVK